MDHPNRTSRPRRLRRLAEVWTNRTRPLFFVTICTADRGKWLNDPEVHEVFKKFCIKSPELTSVWIGKYVIMPDHIHVFVSAEGSRTLSKWVGSLKGVLGATHRKSGQASPAWQEGFFDHLMRGAESYTEKWEYVRMNPLRAALVPRPEDWPYCGEIHVVSWE